MKMAENELLLSFILPVYNVEDYMHECVDSILRQITQECEVILVDDGSGDSSGKICDRYAAQWDCVKVIHKKNGGLSSARNAGLPAAGGRYITFVDSDDRIAPGSVDKLLAWIRNHGADLCFLQAEKFFPDGSRISLGEQIESAGLRGKDRAAALAYLSGRPKYPGSAWAKLYRREYLEENDLHFPHDRRYSEDLGFIRDCMLCAGSFDAVEVPYYGYRQNRQGSITNRVTSKNFFDLFRFVAESAELLTRDKMPKDDISQYMMRFVGYEYLILFYLYRFLPAQDRKQAGEKLKEYQWILQYASGARGRMVAVSCRVLGIGLTSRLLELYRKLSAR